MIKLDVVRWSPYCHTAVSGESGGEWGHPRARVSEVLGDFSPRLELGGVGRLRPASQRKLKGCLSKSWGRGDGVAGIEGVIWGWVRGRISGWLLGFGGLVVPFHWDEEHEDNFIRAGGNLKGYMVWCPWVFRRRNWGAITGSKGRRDLGQGTHARALG